MTHGGTSWSFSTPDKILVATDLTDLDYLLPSAIAQCRDCEASLILAHAIAPVESMSLADSALLIADVARARAQKSLHEARKITMLQGRTYPSACAAP